MLKLQGNSNGVNNERFWRTAVEILSPDLTQYGVKKEMKYFDAGLLCTKKDVRKLKIGTKMIEKSLKMAKDAGADFYKVFETLLF